MTPISPRSWIAAAGLAIGLGVLSPATASADSVDDLLNRFPSGQISCEQAGSYWTSESDYNSKRSQAQMLANFHPRGAEIRDALARVDDAAHRCGLKGGGTPAPAPAPAPAANPTAPAAAQAPVIPVLVAPGVPSVTVPVAGVGTVQLPDLARIITDFLGQFAPGYSLPR